MFRQYARAMTFSSLINLAGGQAGWTQPVAPSTPPPTARQAQILHECAKATLAGRTVMTLQDFKDIDACAALVVRGLRAAGLPTR